MASIIYIWFLCFHNASNLYPNNTQQTEKSVVIRGRCYDVSTAVRLKAKVSATFKSKNIDLAESGVLGVFNLLLTDSSGYLSFRSDGYQPVTIPINTSNESGRRTNFSLSIPMAALNSQRTEVSTLISLSFTYKDSIAIDYKLTSVDDPNWFASFSGYNSWNKKLISEFTFGNQGAKDWVPGEYILTGYSNDGRLVVKKDLKVRQGLNFKSVVVKNSQEEIVLKSQNKKLLVSKNPSTLYFDQSSYELRPTTATTLDSVASYLLVNREKLLQIIGHTDNVGNRKRNVTLSEYRARTVTNYLKQKGILSEQIELKWYGPDSTAAPNDTEENKAKNRRVLIRIADRD